MLFVWSVYFSIQVNQANYLNTFIICMSLLEYIDKTTQSVKGKFQESWELSELIQ